MNLFKNKKMSKIEINCKNYSDFLIIGYGTYGTVYKAIDNRNGLYISIKEINKDKFKKQKEILKSQIKINKNKITNYYVKFKIFYIIIFCKHNSFFPPHLLHIVLKAKFTLEQN